MDFWRNRKVLVTGCNGFLGSAVCRELNRQNAKITGVCRTPKPSSPSNSSLNSSMDIDLMVGDITDPSFLDRSVRQSQPEIAFHFAGLSDQRVCDDNPSLAQQVNVGGTQSLVDALAESPHRAGILFSSSSTLYARPPANSLLQDFIDEDSPIDLANNYVRTKHTAEEILLRFGQQSNRPIAIVRLTNIFGPADPNRDRLINAALDAALDRRAFVQRSPGTLRRDFLFIDDAVEAIFQLAQAMLEGKIDQEVFNISGPESVSHDDAIAWVNHFVDHPNSIAEPIARPSQGRPLVRHEKATRRIGWRPECLLEEGIRRTIEWHQANRGLPSTDHSGPAT
jgi:CDP-glucose 4,6-dehydratase